MKKFFLAIAFLVSMNLFAAEAAAAPTQEGESDSVLEEMSFFPALAVQASQVMKPQEGREDIFDSMDLEEELDKKEFCPTFLLGCYRQLGDDGCYDVSVLEKEKDRERYASCIARLNIPLASQKDVALLIKSKKERHNIFPEGVRNSLSDLKIGFPEDGKQYNLKFRVTVCNDNVFAVQDEAGHTGGLCYNPAQNCLTLYTSLLGGEKETVSGTKTEKEKALWRLSVGILQKIRRDRSKRYLHSSGMFQHTCQNGDVYAAILSCFASICAPQTLQQILDRKERWFFGGGPLLTEADVDSWEQQNSTYLYATDRLFAQWFVDKCETLEDGTFDFGQRSLLVPYRVEYTPGSERTEIIDRFIKRLDKKVLTEDGREALAKEIVE